MACLDHTVHQFYGNTLTRSTSKIYTHHLFTLYQQHPHHFFFKILQLPAFLYISQATLEHKLDQYGQLLPRMYFIPVDRNFQVYTYLVRCDYNIISLLSYLQIKKVCHEYLQPQFFLKCLQFMVRAFRIIKQKQLPMFNIEQIGISQNNQFQLSDLSLYFTGHPHSDKEHKFAEWMQIMVKQVLQLPLDLQKQEEVLLQRFGQHLNIVRPLIDYLKRGEGEPQGTQSLINNAKSRFSDETTTVTGSYAEIHQLVQRNQKEKVKKRRLSFRKMGKLGSIIMLFILLSLLAGVGYFCFRFFNRNVLCQQGEYLDSSRQCLGCSSGCIRCSDAMPNSCQRCDLNMYLVVDEEQDKHGFCLSECRGRLVNVGVCVRQKSYGVVQQIRFRDGGVTGINSLRVDY